MGTTTHVDGKLDFPERILREPSIAHGNVSRLQAIKAAVHTHLEHVSKHLPNARPSLITFSHIVNVFGDGTNKPLMLSNKVLNNFDELFKQVTPHLFLLC